MSEHQTSNSKGGVPTFAVILFIAGAFLIGIFWNRMQTLEKELADIKGGGAKMVANNGAGNVPAPAGNAGNNPNIPPAGQPQLGSAGQVDPVTEEDHIMGNP